MIGSPHVMIPKPDELDLKFYQAVAKAGALHVQRCDACGTWTHPARYYCPKCSSGDFTFAPASGRATVYSYTVSHMSVEPTWQAVVPYVTIVAELAEGPRLVASAKSIRPNEVVLGMPIHLVTETKSPDFAIFWAERVEEKPR
jgi:uncharacterized OB-fold protein